MPMHPLHSNKKPGPVPDDVPASDPLEDSSRVLALVEQGKLSTISAFDAPRLPVAVNRNGKPKKKLTADDEKALARMIQENGSVEARNALVTANVGLVHLMANQMRRPNVNYEDLVQEGLMGLMRATETFDPTRDIRFSTYSTYWIRAKIQRYLQHWQREETPAIGAAPMSVGEDGRRRRPRAPTISVDAMSDLADDEHIPHECLIADCESPEEFAIRRQEEDAVRIALRDACASLNEPRADAILEHRVLSDTPDTFAALGKRLDISREWARQTELKIVIRAKEKLHAFAP